MAEREKKHHFVKGEKPGTFKKISLIVLLIFGLNIQKEQKLMQKLLQLFLLVEINFFLNSF